MKSLEILSENRKSEAKMKIETNPKNEKKKVVKSPQKVISMRGKNMTKKRRKNEGRKGRQGLKERYEKLRNTYVTLWLGVLCSSLKSILILLHSRLCISSFSKLFRKLEYL